MFIAFLKQIPVAELYTKHSNKDRKWVFLAIFIFFHF